MEMDREPRQRPMWNVLLLSTVMMSASTVVRADELQWPLMGGTFGVTGQVDPFSDELVERINPVNDRFEFLTGGSIAGNGWKGRRHNTKEGFVQIKVQGENFSWKGTKII